MAIKDVINDLETASQGERSFDAAIGLLVGWKRKVEYVRAAPNDEPQRKVFWVVPSGDESGKVPHFTTSLDAAWLLAKMISPRGTGGVSWDGERGTAVVDNGPYSSAATPALALCAAALKTKMQIEEADE